MLTKEQKTKWVAALRSGKYKQGAGCLRSYNYGYVYCCLGVLCDIIDPDGWNAEFGTHYGCPTFSHPFFTNNPEYVDTVKLDEGYVDNLVAMNDLKKCTFEQIADYIEECVPAALN